MSVLFDDKNSAEQGVEMIVSDYADESEKGLAAYLVRAGLFHSKKTANYFLTLLLLFGLAGLAYVYLKPPPANKVPAGSEVVNTIGEPPKLLKPVLRL